MPSSDGLKVTEALGPRTVGVIGLGQMGRGIAANLDRAGYLAAAWDIVPEAFAAPDCQRPSPMHHRRQWRSNATR
jgi:phosphoglycerate dehydrogenase-like enzyme